MTEIQQAADAPAARLAAADLALAQGRAADAVDHLVAALTDHPAPPLDACRTLVRQLYLLERAAESLHWSARAVEQHPADATLWSLRGVMLRQAHRQAEALAALDRALTLDPTHVAARANRGNVLLDLGRPAEAEAAFRALLAEQPANAAFLRLHGQALGQLGEHEAALQRLRASVAGDPKVAESWIQLASLLSELQRFEEAEAAIEAGLDALPDSPHLLEAKALVLRGRSDLQELARFLQSLLPRFEDQAWVHFQLGQVVGEIDRTGANARFRRAVELAPDNLDYLVGLAQNLGRTPSPIDKEGSNAEEAYQLGLKALAAGDLSAGHAKSLYEIFDRVCAVEALDRLGDFRTHGRAWVRTGRQTVLLKQLSRVRSHEDKLELLEQHRLWGRQAEATAAANPIRRPPPRPSDGRIRLGFMSSDLRRHAVSYYALPLFDHYDPAKFELYAYSYATTPEDDIQRHITGRVKAFRWMTNVSAREAAQTIADDQLDMLVELGGPTNMNRPKVLAYGPAPRQASWLGYPHSVGLANIDYFICDPRTAPGRPDLLIEEPLVLDPTWITLGEHVFADHHAILESLPEDRHGYITYGTANQPYKYNREVLRTWARTTAATPNARFAFIRPEAGAPSFQRHVLAAFAAEGVSEDRVVFHAIRGVHMPVYNEIDISLDTFPLTGGATTTESLWMGVPVVSLVGEAFFERLSYSILWNAGLADLCAFDLETYQAAALRLAGDRPRRLALRRSLRAQLREGPLGRTADFARSFYDAIARVVTETPGRS